LVGWWIWLVDEAESIEVGEGDGEVGVDKEEAKVTRRKKGEGTTNWVWGGVLG
jgi:hypothetical protein